MKKEIFSDLWKSQVEKTKSLVCVGLDSANSSLPECVKTFPNPQSEFNRRIIESTIDVSSAYKINFAFYEETGRLGMEAIRDTLKYIPQEIPVIADVKRGDIGNTAEAYARAVFEEMGFHACTVTAYMGEDSVQPFAKYANKGVFVVCLSSNKGAEDLQMFKLANGEYVYELMTKKVISWNQNNNLGVVAGATRPADLQKVRELCGPDMLILCPGIGAQSGSTESAVKAGLGALPGNLIINSSRGIIFASKDNNFAQSARESAIKLSKEINASVLK